MRNDLISRQAAIDALKRAEALTKAFGYHNVIDTVMELPSAERRGRWEYIGGYGYQYRCSACIMCAPHKTKYCPNCGARMMDGGRE